MSKRSDHSWPYTASYRWPYTGQPDALQQTRRSVIKAGIATGVSLALPSALLAADAALPLIARVIPSMGEKLPVVGVGTNAFSVTAADEIAARKEVLQQLPQLGGSIVDTARGYGQSELVIGQLLAELSNREQIFLATKTPNNGDVSNGAAVLAETFQRLRTNRIDLLQIHNLHGLKELYPVLLEAKQAGNIRYIGVTTSTDDQYPQLLEAIRNYRLDFVQVDYSIENRGAADVVLPLAQEKGLGVLINVPLGGRRGSLLTKVANKPLPEWATAELDVTSWAQLLLKYNVSHPAVTAVIPGTTKASHLQDNQRAARGRLPTPAQRKRIEELWSAI